MSPWALQHPAPLDPKMAYLLQQIHKAKTTPFWQLTPEAAKAQYHRFIGVFEHRGDASVQAVGVQIKCTDLERVRLVRYRAATYTPDQPTLLFIHGGGYILGSVAGYDNLCRFLAQQTQGQVIAIDYKKSPEYPFPYATNEVFQVLQTILRDPERFAVDPQQFFVMGDSAGGTLAIQAVVRCAQDNLRPAGCILVYPGTAGYPQSASFQAYQTGYLLEASLIHWMFKHYLPEGVEPDWRFFPLQAPNLEKFPPVFIQLAECDPLVDEGLEFARLLQEKGIPVDTKIYRGMVHGFYQFDRALPQAQQAQQDTVLWVQKQNEKRETH